MTVQLFENDSTSFMLIACVLVRFHCNYVRLTSGQNLIYFIASQRSRGLHLSFFFIGLFDNDYFVDFDNEFLKF